jgi:hypothetical protein
MKIILVAVYGLAALFALACGWVYPSARSWSHLAGGSCLVHLALAWVVAVRPLLDAGKIAAWCWQGISALLVAALLLAYLHSGSGGWLLAALALIGFTSLVTLVLSLCLLRGGFADDPCKGRAG